MTPFTECWINEDKLPPKLPISFSAKISKQINAIYACNQYNTDALCQWDEYIEGLEYDITFIVKTSHRTNRSYVYVFMLLLPTSI